MPRDGSGIYSTPPGTHGIPDTTILSTPYNANVDDVAQDLNTPRPIVAGGTGATTPPAACANLGALSTATGGTVAGNVVVQVPTDAALVLNHTSNPGSNSILGETNGNRRWLLQLGTSANETGANTGSDFGLFAYNDGGTIGSPAVISIPRATAMTNINYGLTVNGGTTTLGGALSGQGADFWNGNVNVRNGLISVFNNNDTGRINIGNSTTHYISFDGTAFAITGGDVGITSSLTVGGDIGSNSGLVSVKASGTHANPEFRFLDTGGTLRGNIFWAAAVDRVIINAGSNQFIHNATDGNFGIPGHGYQPGGGLWNDSSDSRIKHEIGDYTAGLAEILALRPIRYLFLGNDRDSSDTEQPSPHRNAADSGKEFIGLHAQEAETVLPHMISRREGYIDGNKVTDLRDMDASSLIYTLINAVKELAARIQALEAL